MDSSIIPGFLLFIFSIYISSINSDSYIIDTLKIIVFIFSLFASFKFFSCYRHYQISKFSPLLFQVKSSQYQIVNHPTHGSLQTIQLRCWYIDPLWKGIFLLSSPFHAFLMILRRPNLLNFLQTEFYGMLLTIFLQAILNLFESVLESYRLSASEICAIYQDQFNQIVSHHLKEGHRFVFEGNDKIFTKTQAPL